MKPAFLDMFFSSGWGYKSLKYVPIDLELFLKSEQTLNLVIRFGFLSGLGPGGGGCAAEGV